MFNISKIASKFYVPGRRAISLSCVNHRTQDFYSILGVKHNATQSEIKNAYYNLSMKLHPDTNKGSQETAEQFRLVTNAYEVLGNIKLRKLYDRGALHGTPTLSAPSPIEHEEPLDKDAKHRFYEAYAKYSRSRSAPSSNFAGQRYDFDAWTKEQYKRTFERRKDEVGAKYDIKKEASARVATLRSIIIMYVVINVSTYLIWKGRYDGDEERARKFEPIVVEKFYH